MTCLLKLTLRFFCAFHLGRVAESSDQDSFVHKHILGSAMPVL